MVSGWGSPSHTLTQGDPVGHPPDLTSFHNPLITEPFRKGHTFQRMSPLSPQVGQPLWANMAPLYEEPISTHQAHVSTWVSNGHLQYPKRKPFLPSPTTPHTPSIFSVPGKICSLMVPLCLTEEQGKLGTSQTFMDEEIQAIGQRIHSGGLPYIFQVT